MNIPDLATFNQLSNACGHCGYPTCDDASLLCESMSRISFCADDDYTDAMDVWNAAVTLREDYEDSEASFAARHALWVDDYAEWEADMAAIPCVPYVDPPVEPVHLPVAPEPGDEPDPNDFQEDYSSYSHSCYAQFQEPEGDPTDEIGTLYRTLKDVGITTYSGTGWAYLSGGGSFPMSGEIRTIGTFVDSEGITGTYVGIGNSHNTSTNSCTSETPVDDNINPNFIYPNDPDSYTTTTSPICSPTEQGTEMTGTWVSNPSPKELEGCPDGVGEFFESFESAGWDYTMESSESSILGDGISKSDLINRAIGKIPATWPEDSEGSSCAASTVVDWPIISDLYIGGDPEADPPTLGSWPECDSLTDLPHGYAAETEVTSWRYKMGIPLFMQAHRLWIIAHDQYEIDLARWVTCGSDPETEPTEPPEPRIWEYFAVQWDVMKFFKEWEDWRILYDAWVEAEAAHAEWEIENTEWEACELLTPGDCGEEPIEPDVPANPTADEPTSLRPEFVEEDLFWEWTGGETLEAQYETDWHVHEAPPEEASIRIVNRQVKCWRNSRLGVPPTFYGETFNPDDYPS